MTQEELVEATALWQARLRLVDWDIHAKVKRERDMEAKGRGGEMLVQLTSRTAWLTLLDRNDLDPDYARLNDAEVTLVHELLHIYTEPLEIPEHGPKHIAEETMLEMVSRALVAAYRSGGDPERP
jgi:hypothetical protein